MKENSINKNEIFLILKQEIESFLQFNRAKDLQENPIIEPESDM